LAVQNYTTVHIWKTYFRAHSRRVITLRMPISLRQHTFCALGSVFGALDRKIVPIETSWLPPSRPPILPPPTIQKRWLRGPFSVGCRKRPWSQNRTPLWRNWCDLLQIWTVIWLTSKLIWVALHWTQIFFTNCFLVRKIIYRSRKNLFYTHFL
jgi:hypothetical protein